MITINTIAELRTLYTKAEETFDKHIESLGLDCEEELWDKYHEELDEEGFWKHISCDEIWCYLDYIGKQKQVYPIIFTFEGEKYTFMFDVNDKYTHMLFVNMLFCLYEIGEEIALNGESLKKLYHTIEC